MKEIQSEVSRRCKTEFRGKSKLFTTSAFSVFPIQVNNLGFFEKLILKEKILVQTLKKNNWRRKIV